MPARRRDALAVGAGTFVTLALTAVLLWPALGRGELLYRDFVTVPDPSVTARTLGVDGSAPRAVPLDLVTALLDPVIPSGVQQQVMLLATLVLAGTGVTLLLRRRGPAVTAVGAALATWSPYAVERLLVGQPPTLLAVSCLGWLVVIARDVRPRRRYLGLTVVAALPAALTPFGGALAASAAVVAGVLVRRAARREVLTVLAVGIAWCAPWLVAAAVGRTEVGQEAGAAAFAVRAPGLAGILDVLGGGGVWSQAATPASRGGVLPSTATVVVLVLAAIGVVGLRRLRGLAAAALLAPLAVALLAGTGPGLAVSGAAQVVPGLGLFRDTHRLVGVSAIALAVLAPIGLDAVAARLRHASVSPGSLSSLGSPTGSGGPAGRVVSGSLAVVGLAVAVLTVPDAPRLLHAAYQPVSYPAGWARVVDTVGERHALLLPWQPMRQVGWARSVPFLDTAPLALRGEVTRSRSLLVERDGRPIVVGPTEPPTAAGWQAGRLDPVALRAAGIEVVLEWRGTPGVLPATHDGLQLVLDTPDFRVWQVPASPGASGAG